MSDLAISLRDVTIDVYLTPHIRTSTYKQLKGECKTIFHREDIATLASITAQLYS